MQRGIDNRNLRGIAFFWLAALLCACGGNGYDAPASETPEPPVVTAEFLPATVSQFGHRWIRIAGIPESLAADEPQLRFGSRTCLLPQWDESGLVTCLAQGSAEPGATIVTISGATDSLSFSDTFQFSPASASEWAHLGVLGASIAAGVMNDGLSYTQQLQSVGALVARRLGADCPWSLIAEEGLPGRFGIDDLDPDSGDVDEELVAVRLNALMAETDTLEALRLDPELKPANLALPFDARAEALFETTRPSEKATFIERALRDPAGVYEPGRVADTLNAAPPDLLLVTWEAVNTVSGLRPDERSFSDDELDATLSAFFEFVTDLEPEPLLLLLNAPPPNLWPGRAHSDRWRYEAIRLNNRLAQWADRINLVNGRTRVQVVDLFSVLSNWALGEQSPEVDGLVFEAQSGLNGETDWRAETSDGVDPFLGFDRFEGWFTLDGETWTATAHALVANLTLDAIDVAWGSGSERPLLWSELEPVNVASVLADDPLSAAALHAALGEAQGPDPALYRDVEGLRPFLPAHRCAIGWETPLAITKEACPASLRVGTGDGITPTIEAWGIWEMPVTVFDAEGQTLTDYPVAAWARDGRVVVDSVSTDENGKATFVYLAPETGGVDTVTIYCGAATFVQEVKIHAADE